MSILIKGMEMPTSCRACMYSRTDIRNVDWCVLTEKDLPCDCPIVPVPKHGRLIDAEVLLESIKEAKKKQPEISDVYDEDYFAVAEWVSYAPTVIESEGE